MAANPNRRSLEPLTLAIDFDGVIHDDTRPRPGKRMGLPMMGAVEAVKRLYDRGFKIVIHTIKARTANGTKAVEDWLEFFEVPYHEVTAIKPDAVLYLDNKGLRFVDWQHAINDIFLEMGLEEELVVLPATNFKRAGTPVEKLEPMVHGPEPSHHEPENFPKPEAGSSKTLENMNDLYSTFYEDEEGESDGA